MKSWLTTSLAFITLTSSMTLLSAVPEDKSVKAWKTFKKKVETDVDQEVDKVFKDRIVFIKGFKDRVHTLGTIVKVTRTIGRARTVEGLFRDLKKVGKDSVAVEKGSVFNIKEFYAVISNTKYRLDDLDRESALRLLYGGLPVDAKDEAGKALLRENAIVNYVTNELAKVEKIKAVRREQMTSDRFGKAGYNEMFFSNNIVIGDLFYSPTELGISKLILKVDIPRSLRVPCAEFKLQVQCPFDGIVVLKLGDKTIAASSQNYTKPAKVELKKYILKGFINRKDLGGNPAVTIAKATVQFICSDIDSRWIANAKGTTHPKSSTRYKTELIGFSMVKSTYSKVSSTIKVDLKNDIWKAKDYQLNRGKEMKQFLPAKPAAEIAPPKVKPVAPTVPKVKPVKTTPVPEKKTGTENK